MNGRTEMGVSEEGKGRIGPSKMTGWIRLYLSATAIIVGDLVDDDGETRRVDDRSTTSRSY